MDRSPRNPLDVPAKTAQSMIRSFASPRINNSAEKQPTGDTQRYEELKTEYTETKRALDGARRRYGTPAPPHAAPGTPFEDERL